MPPKSIGKFAVVVPYEQFVRMPNAEYFVHKLRQVAAMISEWNNSESKAKDGALFLGSIYNSKEIVRCAEQPHLTEVAEVIRFEGDIPVEYDKPSDCERDLQSLAACLTRKLELPAHTPIEVKVMPD